MNSKRLSNPSVKRVWFITDTHLGVRNNSNDWLDQTRDYFNNWFFPTIKENYKSGDILIHLGDYFDSRQSLNLKVLDLGIEIAEQMSMIFKDGVYIIVGNHDIWGKTTNNVNSLKSIKWIPGINVYEEPETVLLGDKKFFFMPWRKDHEAEKETLDSAEKHDILCCHTDINGLRFNRYSKVEHGPEVGEFNKFGIVYSGHIHYSQRDKNIRMLGSPYEITRSDMDNQKSITLLDLENLEETVFINDYSPKFKRFYFSEILEMSPDDLEPLFRNNFVDIMIDPSMAIKAPLSILTDIITTQRTLKFHPFDSEKDSKFSQEIMDTEGKQFNVLDFIAEYVDALDQDEETKKKMKASLFKLHKIVTTQEQELKVS
jgi:DNA repair exonuclease SbcCD nuclease subunit